MTTPPKYLYKFRSLADKTQANRVKQIFSTYTLYCSKPADFNDPFDCCPAYSWQGTKREIKQFIKDVVDRYYPNRTRKFRQRDIAIKVKDFRIKNYGKESRAWGVEQFRKKLKEEPRVLSLTGNSTHILMWSHYANNHEGTCLRFKTDVHEDMEIGSFAKTAHPVIYKDRRPVINVIKKYNNESYKKSLLIKSSLWVYEEEWRIINMPDKSHTPPKLVEETFTIPPKSLDAVILGANISQENEKQVRSWAETCHFPIQVFKAEMSEHLYEILTNEV